MILFSWIVSRFALLLLRPEWEDLRGKVLRLHARHREDTSGIPPRIVQALLLSAEDHRFFGHGGVDPIAIARAFWRNLMFGAHEGASTVEMQLVRVLTGRFERKMSRKIREVGLATLLGSVVPRSEIPAMYLRIAYYGTGMVGFTKACNRLSLSRNMLTRRQAASLVARLKYPEPRRRNNVVLAKIERRTRHLLSLYESHSGSKVYHDLYRGASA